jgi:hypothetical protein
MRDKPHSFERSAHRRARSVVGMAASVGAVVAICLVVISLAHHGRDISKSTSADSGTAIQAHVSSGPPTTSPSSSASSRPRTSKSTPRRRVTTPVKSKTAPDRSPTPAPSQVTRLTGCASDPHTCGYPDATNTGVQPGTRLTNVPGQIQSGSGWKWETDHIVVTSNGATLSDLNIAGGWVEIDANNVTLDNLNIVNTGDWWGVGLYCQAAARSRGCSGSVIEHTSIGSPDSTGANRMEVGIKDVYGDAVGTRIDFVNVYHTSTAIQISNGVIENSYIHDFGYNAADGDHLNGISVGGGDPRPLLIQHNTVLNNYGQTDAIALFQDFGPETSKTITDNLLAGGSYSLYGGGPNGCVGPSTAPKCDPSSNIVVTNNVFSTIYSPLGASYGPVANFNAAGSGNVWSNNTWADGHLAGHAVSP